MKPLIPKINLDNRNTIRIPDSYPVKCPDCDWKGTYADRDIEEEQDGWEMPKYTISVCPECGTPVEV